MISEFKKYIKNHTDEYIIFDIGSRDCEQSIEFYKSFPNAKIYSFECNPNTLNLCRTNILNYRDRITLIEGAVCDYDGNITFYPINQNETITSWSDGNPGASSLFKSNGNYTVEKYVQDEIIVNCHRLDTIMQKYNIPKVDIIWMDLQGAELLALKGLSHHLNDVKYIHTEVTHKEIYSGQVMYKELNDYILSYGFKIKNNLSLFNWQEDVIYSKNQDEENIKLSDDIFDIVILVGPNDQTILNKQITFTKKNIIGYRNIYLICFDDTIQIDGCITINENIFPFTINTVKYIHGESERNGWYLQQLLKMYAGKVIPNILQKYLVIDCDTFFLKPTTFTYNGKCLYNFGYEYHNPYFIHMAKMDESFFKIINVSGICHHMMFEVKYVNEIIDIVEKKHNDTFYNIFLKMVEDKQGSGSSEYELYFNYIFSQHSNNVILRQLLWNNVNNIDNINNEKYLQENNLNYVSYHWYMR